MKYLGIGLLVGLLVYAPDRYEDPRGVRFTPPAAWESVYTQLAKTCGVPIRLRWETLEWYRMPQNWFQVGTTWVVGFRHNARIYVGPDALRDPELFVVRHELLHTMNRRRGHPPLFRRCGLDPSQYLP